MALPAAPFKRAGVQIVKIYVDTNVLHYFGTAFADANLAADPQVQLVLAPLVLLELLSQLGAATRLAEQAFVTVRALPRFDFEMLPWPDDFFRMSFFNLPAHNNEPDLSTAVVNVLNAAKADDLRDEGEEMRAVYHECRHKAAENFSALLSIFRSQGSVRDEERRAIFARCIGRRAGFDEIRVDVNFIVNSLNAYYVLENDRIQAGVQNRAYNVGKHSNDVYDAEALDLSG